MASWTDVTRLMRAEKTAEREPGKRVWRVKKKLVAWERPLRKATSTSSVTTRRPATSSVSTCRAASAMRRSMRAHTRSCIATTSASVT